MSCDQYEKLLYLYKEGELCERDQQALSDHLEGCRHCQSELEEIQHLKEMTQVLRDRPPILSNSDRLKNRIMREVQEERLPDPLMSNPGRFEQFINWLGTARVRVALISAAVVIVLLFAFQEMMILSRISGLERKIESTARFTPMVANSEGLEGVIEKLLADVQQSVGDNRITLSRGQLQDLLGEYLELRNENVLLRNLMERRFPELAQYFRQGTLSEEEWKALFRAYGGYIDLLRQL